MQRRNAVQLQPLGLFEYAGVGIVDFFVVQADDSRGPSSCRLIKGIF